MQLHTRNSISCHRETPVTPLGGRHGWRVFMSSRVFMFFNMDSAHAADSGTVAVIAIIFWSCCYVWFRCLFDINSFWTISYTAITHVGSTVFVTVEWLAAISSRFNRLKVSYVRRSLAVIGWWRCRQPRPVGRCAISCFDLSTADCT